MFVCSPFSENTHVLESTHTHTFQHANHMSFIHIFVCEYSVWDFLIRPSSRFQLRFERTRLFFNFLAHCDIEKSKMTLRSFEGKMWFSSCVCSEPGFFRIRWWICANYSTLHALGHMKKKSQVSGAVLMKLERRDLGQNPSFLIFWKNYFTSIICLGT